MPAGARGWKATTFSDVEDIAAHYCRQISAATLEGPYVLCGFSFGGLVAFETARQLYERDRASTLLFLVEPSLPASCMRSSLSRIVHRLRELPSVAPSRRSTFVRTKANACVQLVQALDPAGILCRPFDIRTFRAGRHALVARRRPVPPGGHALCSTAVSGQARPREEKRLRVGPRGAVARLGQAVSICTKCPRTDHVDFVQDVAA